MADFKTHIVTNINDYFDVIKKIKKENKVIWFRGQNNSSYMLTPKIMRNMKAIKNQYGEDIRPQNVVYSNKGESVLFPNIKNILDEFKEKTMQFINIKPKNNFEWLFIAQHYGLPTPLLDWSTDPLVALFFAIDKKENIYDGNLKEEIKSFENNQFSDKGAAVFAMDPANYNGSFSSFKMNNPEPIDVVEMYDQFKGFINEGNERFLMPLCIKGTTLDRRICRQSGNFTIHGTMVWPIDYPDVVKNEIHKIFIPNSCIEDLRNLLAILDITEESIYGGQNIKDEISFNIEKYMNEGFFKRIDKLIENYDSNK